MQKQSTCCSATPYKQTPYNVALFMAALLQVGSDEVVYDPSTGGGMLPFAVMSLAGHPAYKPYEIHAKELHQAHWDLSPLPALHSFSKGAVNFEQGDCIDEKSLRAHKIIMNSPFKNGLWIKHIRHVVFHNLLPGGRLVSFIPAKEINPNSQSIEGRFMHWLTNPLFRAKIIQVEKPDLADPYNCDKSGAVLIIDKLLC